MKRIAVILYFFAFSSMYAQESIENLKDLLHKRKLDQAIQLDRKIKATTKQGTHLHAQLLNLETELWLKKGQNTKALEKGQKALRLYQNKFPAYKEEIADVYNNLGLIYWNTYNQQLALEYLFKSLNIKQKNKTIHQEEIADSYNNIGLVYNQSKEYDKALNYFERTAEIYTKIHHSKTPKLANVYNNMAIVYQNQKQFTLAEKLYRKSLTIYKENNGNNHVNVAFIYNYLAQLELEEKDIDKAEAFAQEALKIYQRNYTSNHPEIAKTYMLLGNINQRREKRKNIKKALKFYQYAFIDNTFEFNELDYKKQPNTNNSYDSNVLLRTFLRKAQTLERLYALSLRVQHLRLAITNLEKCDSLIVKIRQERISKSDKIALGEVAHEVYEDAIRISLKLSEITLKKVFYMKKAFAYSEKNKASVLLSSISETTAKNFARIPQKLIVDEKALKTNITDLRQKILKDPQSDLTQERRDKLFELNRKYESFIKMLENTYPKYYNLKYQISFPSVEELKKSLTKNEAILSYFIASKTNRIFIFKIDRKGLSIRDIPQNKRLTKIVKALRNSIRFQSKRVFVKKSYELYQQLFPRRLVNNIDKLVIIPDGILSTIPFESLLTQEAINKKLPYSEYHYLIKKYAVSYAYSATLFYQNKIEKSTLKTIKNSKILVCSPVTFDQNFLNPLPATKLESNQIYPLFGTKSKVLLEAEAKESHFKKNDLKTYDFIHLSTHGKVNEINPELSAIFLRKDKDNDGILYSNEIYGLQLNASLVTLSACETGLGRISQGEGIIGLSRALLYAGAKNMMVSLWEVSDQSTAEFMIDFYTALKHKIPNSFSKTLRMSKLRMIQHQKFSAPYYWASFILIGK